MKPKTKFQQKIVALSKGLPKITEPQKRWAFKNCFEHIGKRNAKGEITCFECGHKWKNGNGSLADAVLGCKCPQCVTQLSIINTRKRVFKQIEYFGIVATCGDCQVIRFFYITVHRKAGERARYDCSEVVQRWLSSKGKEAVVARLRGMSAIYYDYWSLGSPLELRSFHRGHNITPICFYPRQRILSEIIRNGFNGEYHGINPFGLLRSILMSNKAETLLKTGQHTLLNHFIYRSPRAIDTYWGSIRICIRNGYTIEDGSMWCDYIDQLNFFGKDINSPKFVCPDNLHQMHDLYMKKRRAYNERQRLEEQRQQAREDKETFKELKAKFFGLAFFDKTMEVRVLESVEEFIEEGKAMHHCVFGGGYYLRPNSLVLSARIDGNRIETVEVSLETMEVVQSRGLQNCPTEHNKRIIDLVKKNMYKIEQRHREIG